MQLPGEPVRIRVDVSQTPGGALNVVEEPHRKPVAFWRGDDLRFEIGIFNDGVPVDMANIGSFTVEVKDLHLLDGGPLMSETLSGASVVDTITAAGWEDGTEEHAVAEFASSETFLDLLGRPAREFWLTIYGETTDATPKKVVFGAAKIFVFNSGAFSGLPVVTPLQPAFFSQSSILFTRETPIPVGEYLIGSPKFSIALTGTLVRFTASAPVGTPSVFELEVDGVLSGVQITIPSGTLGAEVTGEVVISQVIPTGKAVRWKHVSGPASPINFPSVIGFDMRVEAI